jgi:hypothetical protein
VRVGAIVPTLGELPERPRPSAIARTAEAAADWDSAADRDESLTCCAWLAASTGS